MGTLQCRLDSTRERNVIVFDQHAIRQIEAVILSTAATHGIFVEWTQTGSGLPGIEDFCFGAGYGLNELSCQGSDSAQPLQKVENHPFAGQQHPSIMPNDCDGLA